MTAPNLVAPVFVVLWSTGFISAKLGLPYAEPMTFLAVRFGLVALLMAAWVWISGARWPNGQQWREQALIGALVHFFYLGGVFVAISWGIEAGLSALIVGLQPVVMALMAMVLLGERLVLTQWLGMALGLAGVALVVLRKLDAGVGDWAGVAICAVGLIGIALGTILQKRLSQDTPQRAGFAVQFGAASACCGICALLFEDTAIDWAPPMIIAMTWSIVVLSFGAVTLLYVLIRRGAASNVASLFFLVPPCTALMAWGLFGEVLGWVEIGGLCLTALGVLAVNRPDLFRRHRRTI
ncbi:MAG: DMT family transporter [Pseudomonadota bacterium]